MNTRLQELKTEKVQFKTNYIEDYIKEIMDKGDLVPFHRTYDLDIYNKLTDGKELVTVAGLRSHFIAALDKELEMIANMIGKDSKITSIQLETQYDSYPEIFVRFIVNI